MTQHVVGYLPLPPPLPSFPFWCPNWKSGLVSRTKILFDQGFAATVTKFSTKKCRGSMLLVLIFKLIRRFQQCTFSRFDGLKKYFLVVIGIIDEFFNLNLLLTLVCTQHVNKFNCYWFQASLLEREWVLSQLSKLIWLEIDRHLPFLAVFNLPITVTIVYIWIWCHEIIWNLQKNTIVGTYLFDTIGIKVIPVW